MFESIETPKLFKKLTKFTGSEQHLLLNYFYYELTTDDLIEIILDQSSDRDILNLLEALTDDTTRV